jgi:CheY-like chemotaxis protein
VTSANPATILLVEDDADIRTSLADILTDEGYRVRTAANGSEALQQLRERDTPRPALILLDLMMPVMDGWKMREEMLKDSALASIPVVVLSGVIDLGHQATALGAAAYITKPFELGSLVNTVHQLC